MNRSTNVKGSTLMLCLGLSACVAPASPGVNIGSVTQQDFAPWSGDGPANIEGQAFLNTMGGQVITCAGNPVYLYPGNDYDAKAVAAMGNNQSVSSDVDIINNNVRRTTCDASGNFSFSNLPAKAWFVVTSVEWQAPDAYDNQAHTEGGVLVQPAILLPGNNQVMLTSSDLTNAK